MYHYVDLPPSMGHLIDNYKEMFQGVPNNATPALHVATHSFEGRILFTAAIDHPPIHVSPPFGESGIGTHADSVIRICDAELNHR